MMNLAFRYVRIFALVPVLSVIASLAQADENEILRQSCLEGSWFACSLLAQEFKKADDYASAATVYETACGFRAGACALLGRLYLEGKGVEQDDEQAYVLFEKSCTQDSEIRGCFFAGQMNETGRGTPSSPEAAAKYYAISCDGGLEAACAALDTLTQ